MVCAKSGFRRLRYPLNIYKKQFFLKVDFRYNNFFARPSDDLGFQKRFLLVLRAILGTSTFVTLRFLNRKDSRGEARSAFTHFIATCLWTDHDLSGRFGPTWVRRGAKVDIEGG